MGPFSRVLGQRITSFFCSSLWCAPCHHFWNLRFLPAFDHEMVDQGVYTFVPSRRYLTVLSPVHGSFDVLQTRSRGRCPLLCLLGHITADHFYLDWCHLQYVFLNDLRVIGNSDSFSDSVKEIIQQIGRKSFQEIISNLDSKPFDTPVV